MIKAFLFSFWFTGALLCPALAQHSRESPFRDSDDLHEMVKAVKPARARKTDKQTVVSLCDKILARDVIADFIAHGTSPAYHAISALKRNQELGARVEGWREELEGNPESERLNYLMAVAAMHYSAQPTRIGRLNVYPPVRIRIIREGGEVTGETVDRGNNFKESAKIAMPGKVYIGLAGNYTTGIIKGVTLTANGEQVPNPQWQPIQIGGDSARGKVEVSDEGIRLTGVGTKPSTNAADNNFFAFHELDGDGSLEATIESISPDNKYGALGIMIRSSLNPSAPFASIMLERNENTVSFSARKEQNEFPHYLVKLCGLRPHDPAFVTACLREMISGYNNMPGPAYQAAERLLERVPTAILTAPDLFKEVYSKSYHFDRFSKHLAAVPASPEGQGEALGTAWVGMADDLQHCGNHEEAIALWDKAERLAGETAFPVEIRQKRLISYRKLNRSGDAVAELKKLFLGSAEKVAPLQDPKGRSGAELILDTVSLSDPALVPSITLSFHYAVHYGVAREIAEVLERSQGTPEQKASANAVALALRLAARDPEVIAAAKRDGAGFAAQLPKNLSEPGLAMIAFLLQQFTEGEAAAFAVVERMLNQNARPFSSYSRGDLLLWYCRLADFQDSRKASAKAIEALVSYALTTEEYGASVFSEAMQRLLRAGDTKRAAQVAEHYGRKNRRPGNDPFDKGAEVFGLLDLYVQKAVPMPIVWTNSLGDEVEVQWEFVRDISKPMLQPEVRALGAPIPALDKRYSLDLYAIRTDRLSTGIPEDAKIATLSEVESTGRWKGKIAPSHRWIVAAFKDNEGNIHYSPAIPAVVGKNFVSPLKIDDILNETGAWSASTKSFWGTSLNSRFPKTSLFLSRYQPNVGWITFKHRRVPIDPRENYVFAAWMKADNGQGEAGYRYYADASVAVIFFDAGGKQVAEWKDGVTLGGSWTLLTCQFGAAKGPGILPLPPGASQAEVQVNLRSQCEIADIGFYGMPNER